MRTRTGSGRPARAVVFDLDGTLVDSLDLVANGYIDTVEAFGGPRITRDQLEDAWHLGPTPVMMEHFLGRPAPDAVDHFLQRVRAGSGALALFPGIAVMTAELDAAGIRLGIVTNATRANAEVVLAATGIASLLPVVVCAGERAPKPSPDGLLAVLSDLDTQPGESVYVGDSWVDLACAGSAGVRGVHATWAQPGGCQLGSEHECVRTVDALHALLLGCLRSTP